MSVYDQALSIRHAQRRTRERNDTIMSGGIYGWTESDWFTAAAGELGEAGNCIKKINRIKVDMEALNKGVPERDLRRALEEELADTFFYLLMLASRCHVDLESAFIAKYNKVCDATNTGEFKFTWNTTAKG